MKLRNLANIGVTVLAAASIALVSTSALAKTEKKATTTCPKTVKCYGVNKSGTGYVQVSKSACDQIGGSTTNPNASTSTNPSNPNPSMTTPSAAPAENAPENTNTPNGGVTTSNPNQ